MCIVTRVSILGAESGKLVGVAIAYGTRSQDLGGFVEIIEPGAFSKHLATNPDVRALYEHDKKDLLGRTASGTLKMSDSQQELAVEIDPPATRAGADCVELVKRGDLSGMSFGFSVVRDHWDMKAKPPVRRTVPGVSSCASCSFISRSCGSAPAGPFRSSRGSARSGG